VKSRTVKLRFHCIKKCLINFLQNIFCTYVHDTFTRLLNNVFLICLLTVVKPDCPWRPQMVCCHTCSLHWPLKWPLRVWLNILKTQIAMVMAAALSDREEEGPQQSMNKGQKRQIMFNIFFAFANQTNIPTFS